jgi:hypothetical protein
MALEGKAEGNFFSAVSEMFKFLASCELTQFPISESNSPLSEKPVNKVLTCRLLSDQFSLKKWLLLG